MSVSLLLSSANMLQGHPARRIAFELQRILNRTFLKQISNDALAGGVSKETALKNVQKLYEQGAEVDAINPETGENVLMVATWFSTPEVVRFLLKRGADVHTPDYRGRLPLHNAATRKSPKFVSMLLEYGAEDQVNEVDAAGRTSIENAACSGCADTVLLLMKHDAVLTPDAISGLKMWLRSPRNDQEYTALQQALAIAEND